MVKSSRRARRRPEMNLFGDVLLPVALFVYGLIGAVVNRRRLPREFRPLVDAVANLGFAGLAPGYLIWVGRR